MEEEGAHGIIDFFFASFHFPLSCFSFLSHMRTHACILGVLFLHGKETGFAGVEGRVSSIREGGGR